MKHLTDKRSGKEYRETDCRDWSQGFAFVYVLPVKIVEDSTKTEYIKKLKENVEQLEGLSNRLKNLKKALKETDDLAPRKRRR